MGANPITETSLLTCSFGSAPASLNVTSQPLVKMCGMKAGTILDNKPLMFGTCVSPANPEFALTGKPAVCVGAAQISAPWISSSTVRICGRPAIHKDCKLICNYGGVIQASMTPAMLVRLG
ncbi:MAG: DUF4280 domain-containing protein [Faecalibacterium sp.]